MIPAILAVASLAASVLSDAERKAILASIALGDDQAVFDRLGIDGYQRLVERLPEGHVRDRMSRLITYVARFKFYDGGQIAQWVDNVKATERVDFFGPVTQEGNGAYYFIDSSRAPVHSRRGQRGDLEYDLVLEAAFWRRDGWVVHGPRAAYTRSSYVLPDGSELDDQSFVGLYVRNVVEDREGLNLELVIPPAARYYP